MKAMIFGVAFVSAFAVGALNARPLQVCANPRGEITVKPRCKGADIRLSIQNLIAQGPQGVPGPVGPQGPAGQGGVVNIAKCRSIVSSQFTNTGMAFVTASCANNEFMLNYGFNDGPSNQGTQFLHEADIVYSNGGIPVAVDVAASTDSYVYISESKPLNTFTLYVTATCCPLN
jgi:hypothetical protein